MDVLNVLACICVLLLHTNFQYNYYDGHVTFPWLYGCFIFTVAFWAVPVFIMLSVCNLVCYSGGVKCFYIRRFNRIGIPFLFWSILYAVIFYFQKGAFTWQEGVYMFVHGLFNRYMWFFTPLFGLYLSMPFLKIFVENASDKLIWLFICFGFVFESFLPFVFDAFGIEYLFIGNDYKQPSFFSFASNFVYVGILGYMLTHREIPLRFRRIIYSVGVVTAIIHFCILVFGTISTGHVVRFHLNYFYPSSVLIPAAVIVYFRYTNWERFFCSERHANLITSLSSCSLGVYLIHRGLQIISGIYNLYFSYYLVGFLILYLLGVAIVLLMKKIPVLNKCV